MATQIERRRFTVDEYHRMVEAGILTEGDRVELIEGEIVAMSPIGGRHAACVRRLVRLLERQLGAEALVDSQNPIRIDPDGEPQPDVAVLRPQQDYYEHEHPRPADVFLVVEVAETSLAYDRQIKLPIYATAEIPEAWLVDLAGQTLERHTDPREGAYLQLARAGPGDTLASIALPLASLDVDAVLG